jgi:gliding motility-associated-like protein
MVNNLIAGSYSVQISDAVGCSNTHQILVIEPDPLSFEVMNTQPTCNQNNGSIQVIDVVGGSLPFNYSINGATSSTGFFSQLIDTTYVITVTDSLGCYSSRSVLLAMPTAPTAIATSSSDAFCGNANGLISLLNISSGIAPFELSFQNENFIPIASFPVQFQNLDNGNYSLRIRDANGCEISTNQAIEQHPGPSIAELLMQPATCELNNATMEVLSISGGTAPYLYSFNNASYTSINLWENLAPAQHSVVVKDNNGCLLDTFLTIPALENVSANAFIIQPISCFGYSDGALQVVPTSGFSPFNFIWNNGNSGEVADSLSTGTYSVTVTDSNGCTKTYPVNLPNPDPLSINVTGPDYVCTGDPITLNATVGGGTGHLEIQWPSYSHAEETITITPQTSGFIEARVTDENGCPANDSHMVQMRQLPEGQLLPDIAEGCAPVCINFSYLQTAGDSIQNYLWSFNQSVSGSNNALNKKCFSLPGSPEITLQVIDIHGCSNVLNADGLVQIHPNPVAAFSRTPLEADIVNPEFRFFNESTDAVTFRWGFGDGAVSLQENPTHTYADTGNYEVCLKVTSGFGCADSTCDDLDVDPFPTIYAPNVFTPNSDGHNENFKIVVTYATKFRLEIYDRWGELIHVSTDPDKGWDGTYKGNEVQEDVYVWRAYVTNSMNWNKELIGRVTVVE